eukprot:COSAG06_NODE_6291_length_2995_cov_95.512605_5_plen_153_part_00
MRRSALRCTALPLCGCFVPSASGAALRDSGQRKDVRVVSEELAQQLRRVLGVLRRELAQRCHIPHLLPRAITTARRLLRARRLVEVGVAAQVTVVWVRNLRAAIGTDTGDRHRQGHSQQQPGERATYSQRAMWQHNELHRIYPPPHTEREGE